MYKVGFYETCLDLFCGLLNSVEESNFFFKKQNNINYLPWISWFLSFFARIYSSTSVMIGTKKPGMTARISGRKTRLSTGAPRKPTWRSRNHTNTKQDQFKGRKLIQFNCKAFKCYLHIFVTTLYLFLIEYSFRSSLFAIFSFPQ